MYIGKLGFGPVYIGKLGFGRVYIGKLGLGRVYIGKLGFGPVYIGELGFGCMVHCPCTLITKQHFRNLSRVSPSLTQALTL